MSSRKIFASCFLFVSNTPVLFYPAIFLHAGEITRKRVKTPSALHSPGPETTDKRLVMNYLACLLRSLLSASSGCQQKAKKNTSGELSLTRLQIFFLTEFCRIWLKMCITTSYGNSSGGVSMSISSPRSFNPPALHLPFLPLSLTPSQPLHMQICPH